MKEEDLLVWRKVRGYFIFLSAIGVGIATFAIKLVANDPVLFRLFW